MVTESKTFQTTILANASEQALHLNSIKDCLSELKDHALDRQQVLSTYTNKQENLMEDIKTQSDGLKEAVMSVQSTVISLKQLGLQVLQLYDIHLHVH